MKIFLSQPMRGKTDEQIREERANIEIYLQYLLKEHVDIIDSVFDLDEGTHPLVYLGKSIELMADADMVCFMEGWDESRGCVIEHDAAVRYGIKRKYLDVCIRRVTYEGNI